MLTTEYIEFPCLEITQPIGTFYIGVADSKDVIAISFADVRRIEDRDIERYVGLQRSLSDERLKEIRQYVTNVDASFPTGVILALDSAYAEYSATSKTLRIVKRGDAALIIDGQHRIAGLEGFNGTFQLPVICFVDIDMEDKAMMFATINLKQTKVRKSLAYDLFEFSKTRSPQRTCHDIAKVLNQSPNSPFYHSIKILGLATLDRQENLTQAAFVEKFMSFITNNAMRDRDLLLRGSIPRLTADGYDARRHIFRALFLAERDGDMLLSISNFFVAVQSKWPNAWRRPARGIMLGRTNGFIALCDYFRHVWLANQLTDFMTMDIAAGALANINLAEADFTIENYPPGSSGQKLLFDDLVRLGNVHGSAVSPATEERPSA